MSEIWTPSDPSTLELEKIKRKIVTGHTQMGHHGLDTVQILDMPMAHAFAEIKDAYGDIVRLKPKSLLKFGRTVNADDGEPTEIQQLMGGSHYQEKDATGNTIDTLSSGSALDGSTAIHIEGHTVANSELTFVIQTTVVSGQTPVQLATPLFACTRAFNISAATQNWTGPIYIYESSAVSSGVPQVNSSVHLVVAAGQNQSEKAKTYFSKEDYGIITNLHGSLARDAGANVAADMEIQVKLFGQPWRPAAETSMLRNGTSVDSTKPNPYLVVPKNAGVRIIGISNAADTKLTAWFQSYIAIVQSSGVSV